MKLLNRTIKSYLIYSSILILICTPLFYFAIRHLVISAMDDALIAHKEEFRNSIDFLDAPSDLEIFELFNKEFALKPVRELRAHDTLYTAYVTDSLSNREVPHRVYQTSVVLWGENYDLTIRESMVSNKELIEYIVSIQLIFIGMMVVGVYFINRRLSQKIWSPFYHILHELRSFNLEGKHPPTFPRSSTVEFRELTDAIEQLIDTNREAYRNQKEFTENASHELQTPLAICRSKLDLLAQTPNLTPEQAELIGSLLDATDRIARLNKNLLLLSRIENRQFVEMLDVDLRSIAEGIAENLVDQIHEKDIRLEWHFDRPVTIHANAVAIEVLLTNLMSNAVRYTPPGGLIRVAILTHAIEITNSGEALRNPGKIFERFHRDSQSVSSGSGLGLSIVKKICDVYSYRVVYRYDKSMHHFVVSF